MGTSGLTDCGSEAGAVGALRLMGACRRRWPVLAVGLALTGLSMMSVSSLPGVYWSQVQVVFLAPTSTLNPNTLTTESDSLVATAGLVEREVNLGHPSTATTSASVNLVDEGVRSGVLIRLPNGGGQWAYSFSSPVLDVQAAGGTPQEVRSLLDDAVYRISADLDRRQNESSVLVQNRIRLTVSPAEADIYYRSGDPKRAAAAVVLLGTGFTLAAITVTDRIMTNRRARRNVVTTNRLEFADA
jgi:hypothetical protein